MGREDVYMELKFMRIKNGQVFLAGSKLVKRDHEECFVNVFQVANILTIEYVIPPSHKKM